MSSFGPLLSVHAALKRPRARAEEELDEIARDIDRLTRELMEDGGALEPRQVEDRSKKIERLKALYEQYENLPVWPFNAQLVTRLILPQIVPIAGYLGLGQKALRILAPFFGATSGGELNRAVSEGLDSPRLPPIAALDAHDAHLVRVHRHEEPVRLDYDPAHRLRGHGEGGRVVLDDALMSEDPPRAHERARSALCGPDMIAGRRTPPA